MLAAGEKAKQRQRLQLWGRGGCGLRPQLWAGQTAQIAVAVETRALEQTDSAEGAPGPHLGGGAVAQHSQDPCMVEQECSAIQNFCGQINNNPQ